MSCTLLLSLALLAAPQVVDPVSPPTGTWHAWLDCPGGELPFDIGFSTEEGVLHAAVRNGPERIAIPVVTWKDGDLRLGFDYYDSRITARLDASGRRLEGSWTKRRAGTKVVRMVFHAVAGSRARFASASTALPAVAGRWRVQFEKDRHPAVAVFRHGRGAVVNGTFLTALGDYRFLAGIRDGRSLHLSCFDGAHAFLFAATCGDGGMKGDFWSSDTWHETWTAARDAKAKLPDAWKLTTADTSELGRLRFPDLDGKPRTLTDPAFAGKARMLVVFGSWCPNCRDETSYLAALDCRYRKRGLSILGLAFELSGDRQRDTRQLKLYAKRQGIEFPLLLAGLADKKKASQALPILDRVRSYPTTIFLHEDGRVHSVHTGFTGPGTGAEYDKLRKHFESIIEQLLQS